MMKIQLMNRAEHIALGLFEYIIPMLRDIRVCQGYTQLQVILKIVEYMNWISYNNNIVQGRMITWLNGCQPYNRDFDENQSQ